MSKGFSRASIRNRWNHMIARCLDPEHKNYGNYGGRGISVCQEWREFENYYHWCWQNWKPDTEIDRIDNDGDYSPENCRFTTRTQNARNKRNTTRVEAFGEVKSMPEWVEDKRCEVDYQTLQMRLIRNWEPERAISTPANGTRKGRAAHNAKALTAWGETKTVSEWLRDDRCKIKKHQTIWLRTTKYGWSPEKAMTQPVTPGRPRKQ